MVERARGSTVGVPRCMYAVIVLSPAAKVGCACKGFGQICTEWQTSDVLLCLFGNGGESGVRDKGMKTQWGGLKVGRGSSETVRRVP